MADLSNLGVSMAEAEGYADRVKVAFDGAMTSLAASRPSPVTINAPVVHRWQLDSEYCEVWAVVRVDLGGGHLTELDVHKVLPASTGDLEARYARLDSGVQQLRLMDAEGVLHGLTLAAPRSDDEDDTTPGEPEEWDESWDDGRG